MMSGQHAGHSTYSSMSGIAHVFVACARPTQLRKFNNCKYLLLFQVQRLFVLGKLFLGRECIQVGLVAVSPTLLLRSGIIHFCRVAWLHFRRIRQTTVNVAVGSSSFE